MNLMDKIQENIDIGRWATLFKRNPMQLNQLHETDAELLEISDYPGKYFAITIDTVAEEITSGLYSDPYTMGWVTIMACLSDLAAVGATPLGVLISVSYEPTRDQKFISEVARGMEEACRELEVFILGGDTNTTETISLTACSFGLIENNSLLTRRGCKPGDEVYITGGAGSGNALGLVRLAGLSNDLFPEDLYRPRVNFKAGRLLKNGASCCMDTSDGVLTTLDQLMRLNNVGFDINCIWENILLPEVMELCNKTGTPPWMMLAGLHGEFLLLSTIPPLNVEKVRSELKSEGIDLIHIGKVKANAGITCILPSGEKIDIEMAPVRNLLQTVNGDLDRYISEFWNIGHAWGLNAPLKQDE